MAKAYCVLHRKKVTPHRSATRKKMAEGVSPYSQSVCLLLMLRASPSLKSARSASRWNLEFSS